MDIPRKPQKKLRRRSRSLDLIIVVNLQLDLKRVAPARRPRNPTELEDLSKEELAKIPQTRTERLKAAKKKKGGFAV